MSDAARWARVKEIFDTAVACRVENRPALLRELCGDDRALQIDVESLLAADAGHGSLFDASGDRALRGRVFSAVAGVLDERSLALTPGDRLATYEINGLLGAGGMGRVYRAHDTTLHRLVALKVVDQPSDSETSRSQLLREARNAAALNHPNICTVYEVGESNGSAFIAMEYVEGRSLRDRVDEGALPLNEAIRFALQAADALSCAHEHDVVHRDFKAANVMITGDGRLKIVDFGLARRADALAATATRMASVVPVGAAAGTPYAMAPEQVRGDPADARTDIWALGVLLYEMVTGAPPFRAATVPELFSSILRDPPASWPAGVPVNIKSVIDRCLEKDPARRYQHAREVRAALDAVQSGLVPPWIAWRYYLARRRWPAAAAALLGVAAVVVAVNMGGVRERFGGNPPMPIKLAVLPFENLTGDPDQEYLSAGLTDEMITQLGRLHPQRLSVIARTSSMRYKSRDTPIDQIGRELGVGYLLEGSARREGTRVSISARLIRVRDQTQQWADSYTRELGGILTLQNDVAVGVARALALTLLPAEQARLTRAAQVNPEAYEARLRAVSYLHRGSREDLERALDWLDVALRKDPNYALAHLGVRSVWGYKMAARYVSSAVARPIMQAALQRALALDPSLPEAHGALATTYAWEQWNWEAAEREFVRALELDPTNAGIRSFYGRYLQITQRHAEGLAQMARAVEHDPLSELIRRQYANALIGARRYQEALEHMRGMPAGERNLPGHWNQLSRIFHLMGRYDEALDAEKRKWALFGDREMEEALAQGAAAGGYRMAMRRVADTLAARARKTGEACCWEMYVRAGAQEEALHWIERGVELRHPDIVHAGAPPFDSLRGHPRYQAVLQRLNLANRP